MRLRNRGARALLAAAALCLGCGRAPAQTLTPPPPIPGAGGSLVAPPDPNNGAFYGETALTLDTPAPYPGRSLKAVCTVAGAVAVTYFDRSTGTWTAAVGTQTWPIAVTAVNSAGTTASCTYTNLK
jgi:hypothetical protein